MKDSTRTVKGSAAPARQGRPGRCRNRALLRGWRGQFCQSVLLRSTLPEPTNVMRSSRWFWRQWLLQGAPRFQLNAGAYEKKPMDGRKREHLSSHLSPWIRMRGRTAGWKRSMSRWSDCSPFPGNLLRSTGGAACERGSHHKEDARGKRSETTRRHRKPMLWRRREERRLGRHHATHKHTHAPQ